MIYTPTQVVLVLAQEERPLEGVMELPGGKRNCVPLLRMPRQRYGNNAEIPGDLQGASWLECQVQGY